MSRELIHHSLSLPCLAYFSGRILGKARIEVWDDEPRESPPAPHVTLAWDNAKENEFLDLTPAEARALAAMLVMAADSQDRRAEAQPKPVAAFETVHPTEPPASPEPLAALAEAAP